MARLWLLDAAPGAAVAVAQNPGRLCQCRCRSQCGSSLGRPCPWLSPRADSPVAMARLCQWTPRCMLFVGWRQPSNQLCLGTPTGTHCQCSSIASPTLEEQWRSLVSLRCQESQKSLISQTCQPPSLLCRPFLRPGLAATLQSATLVGASTSVGTGVRPLCIKPLLPAHCAPPAPPGATVNPVGPGALCASPPGTRGLQPCAG